MFVMQTNTVQAYELFINGSWIGKELESINVINPATNKIIATVPKGGKKEAIQAVDAAYGALHEWSKKTAEERSGFLLKWHKLIDQEKETIGKVMTKEQGKPIQEAIGEVEYANGFIAWYAEEAKRIYGEMIPASHPSKRIFVQKHPVGVVAAITPWNFPAAMVTRKVGPALAAGCTVVLKPAEQTPLTAMSLMEIFTEAGVPAGVINLVTTDNPEVVGDEWLSNELVRKVTFTGSTEIGKHLMRKAADQVKRISLELGGHAPVVVFDDADIDKAV